MKKLILKHFSQDSDQKQSKFKISIENGGKFFLIQFKLLNLYL